MVVERAVADVLAAEAYGEGLAVHIAADAHEPLVHHGGHGQHFEGGTRLVAGLAGKVEIAREGLAVVVLHFATLELALVGDEFLGVEVEGRAAHHGQNVTRLGIHHNHTAALGAEVAHALVELLLHDGLQAHIDGELQVQPVLGGHVAVILIGQHLAAGVVAVFADAVHAGQIALEICFHTAHALVFVVHIAQHMAEHFGHHIGATQVRLYGKAANMGFLQRFADFCARIKAHALGQHNLVADGFGGQPLGLGLFVIFQGGSLSDALHDIFAGHEALDGAAIHLFHNLLVGEEGVEYLGHQLVVQLAVIFHLLLIVLHEAVCPCIAGVDAGEALSLFLGSHFGLGVVQQLGAVVIE